MALPQILSRKRAFFIFALVGVALLALVIKFKSSPPLLPAEEAYVEVEVMQLEKQPIAAKVTGYGHITPKHLWKAVAEVSGQITYRHPELYKGRFMQAGTLLLSIDKTDYQIRLAQAQAELAAIEGQLAGKDLEMENLELSLKIESKQLALTEAEVERKERLRKQNLISQSELDKERQNYLAQSQRVQDLKNKETLLPNDIKVLEAQLAQAIARAEESQRQLDKTDIYLPYDAQIAEVEIENAQAVGAQQTLVTAHGVKTMTVNAQVSLSDMRVLMQSFGSRPANLIGEPLDVENLPVSASIFLSGQQYQYEWPARLTRVSETVDRHQATVGVILEIDQDLRQPHREQPPLFNGLFVSATVQGVEQPHWLVPERALHQNRLYLMDADERLAIIPVQPLFYQDGLVAISGELEQGMQVVLNDLIPPVQGMKLKALTEESAQ